MQVGGGRGAAMRRILAVSWLVWPLLAMAIVAVLAASAYRGWELTHPVRQYGTGTPASRASLDYRCLPVPQASAICSPTMLATPGHHVRIAAWIVPSFADIYPSTSSNWSQNTVVLVPDHGQSRTSGTFPVWPLTLALQHAGFNVVLFDPRGTGQSGGAGIGFGTVEVNDILAVVNYLPQLGPPQGHVAVWGLGTGADAAIVAASRSRVISAVVADSPYVSAAAYLRQAIPAWTGWPAFPFAETILWSMQRETGISYGAYSPLRAVRSLGGPNPRPLLLVAGANDRLTPPSNIQTLFAASHDSLAQALVVPGASHLQAFAQSPPSLRNPEYTTYMCHALTVLREMSVPRSATSTLGACGAQA